MQCWNTRDGKCVLAIDAAQLNLPAPEPEPEPETAAGADLTSAGAAGAGVEAGGSGSGDVNAALASLSLNLGSGGASGGGDATKSAASSRPGTTASAASASSSASRFRRDTLGATEARCSMSLIICRMSSNMSTEQKCMKAITRLYHSQYSSTRGSAVIFALVFENYFLSMPCHSLI